MPRREGSQRGEDEGRYQGRTQYWYRPIRLPPRHRGPARAEGRSAVKTANGEIVKITTRGDDTIRIGVYGREGKLRTWEVFRVADIEALERALKAAREKIARK